MIRWWYIFRVSRRPLSYLSMYLSILSGTPKETGRKGTGPGKEKRSKRDRARRRGAKEREAEPGGIHIYAPWPSWKKVGTWKGYRWNGYRTSARSRFSNLNQHLVRVPRQTPLPWSTLACSPWVSVRAFAIASSHTSGSVPPPLDPPEERPMYRAWANTGRRRSVRPDMPFKEGRGSERKAERVEGIGSKMRVSHGCNALRSAIIPRNGTERGRRNEDRRFNVPYIDVQAPTASHSPSCSFPRRPQRYRCSV